ncbi:fimbrial protein [uncultured Acinetobacter sp.]|uniref:fimbrial protein n=1 Tax=uncultured Acinetobacter sp. TaxID=165433 RepID=UPI0025E02E90|nr:fimbrial protein [uncultured Acinetobacter sp.]
MKKLQLGLAVISLGLASSTVFAAADGTVTITGQVLDQTCTVTNGNNYVVPLPTVLASTLSTANATAGDTKFTINLTTCPKGDVGIYYDNTNANTNAAGRLKNTIAGGSNVEVQLLNSTKTPIDLTKTSSGQNIVTANVASANGSANIDFFARYFAAAAATAGKVSTSVTYYIVYP